MHPLRHCHVRSLSLRIPAVLPAGIVHAGHGTVELTSVCKLFITIAS